MNEIKPELIPLKNLLENAARTGDTACVKRDQVGIAAEIAANRKLKVDIYVIPSLKPEK